MTPDDRGPRPGGGTPGLPASWWDDPEPDDGGEPVAGGPELAAVFGSGLFTLAVLWWFWSGWWPTVALVFVGGLTACWLLTLAAAGVGCWREGRGR